VRTSGRQLATKRLRSSPLGNDQRLHAGGQWEKGGEKKSGNIQQALLEKELSAKMEGKPAQMALRQVSDGNGGGSHIMYGIKPVSRPQKGGKRAKRTGAQG